MKKLLLLFLVLATAIVAQAWHVIPPTATAFSVHHREQLRRGLEFGIRSHGGDSLRSSFVMVEDVDNGDDDIFDRHMLKLHFGHAEGGRDRVDSTLTLNVSGFERQVRGLSLRVRYIDGHGVLEVGASEPVYSLNFEGLAADTVFFTTFSNSPVAPLRHDVEVVAPEPLRMASFDSVADLESHLAQSQDSFEGLWSYYDHQGSPIRVSPDLRYDLASVKSADGYDLVFLSNDGRENYGIWQPLAVKACLTESGFDGIFNLLWLESRGFPVDRKASAHFEGNLLTLSFPYWDAAIRMVKKNRK